MKDEEFLWDEFRILDFLRPLQSHLERTLGDHVKRRIPVEDILQETFILASRKVSSGTFNNEAAFFGWLKRIATNVALNAIRKKTTASLEDSETRAIVEGLFDSGDISPSELVSRHENRYVLSMVVGRLPDQHQRILQLRYVDGLTFESIASTLNTTASSVRGLHRNALSSVREELGKMSLYLSSR